MVSLTENMHAKTSGMALYLVTNALLTSPLIVVDNGPARPIVSHCKALLQNTAEDFEEIKDCFEADPKGIWNQYP